MVAAKVHVEPAVLSRTRVGSVALLGVAGTASAALDALIATEVARLRDAHRGLTAGQIEHLQPARALYRAFGIDPTRHRPSPEALTRRVLRGDEFPRVHPAVDLANLWALVHGLPVGLYDVAKLAPGPLVLREGLPGESYEGIRRGEIHLEGRLVLADARGAFGNPTADSLRTSVDLSTRDALAVLFAPRDYEAAAMERWLAWLAEHGRSALDAETSWELLPVPSF